MLRHFKCTRLYRVANIELWNSNPVASDWKELEIDYPKENCIDSNLVTSVKVQYMKILQTRLVSNWNCNKCNELLNLKKIEEKVFILCLSISLSVCLFLQISSMGRGGVNYTYQTYSYKLLYRELSELNIHHGYNMTHCSNLSSLDSFSLNLVIVASITCKHVLSLAIIFLAALIIYVSTLYPDDMSLFKMTILAWFLQV